MRFFYIVWILLKFGTLYLLIRFGIYKKQQSTFIKTFFEEAGGSFIKFGQLLALRLDILPREYSLEIMDLLDNVKPFSYKKVEEIFSRELGASPEDIFLDFEREPFAAGSFGQVHRAILDDTIVAIKIMRPGIHEDVQTDLFVINILVYIADLFFKIPALSWREFGEEFKKWTLEELNYTTEAKNAQKMYDNLKNDPFIVIPKTFPKYSTKEILIQEYIEGIHLSKVLRGLKDGRLDRKRILKYGIDIDKTPSILSQAILRQEFYYGFFHADIHPGNIILLKDDKIALIDFGIVGEWRPLNHESFVKFMRSMGGGDFKESTYYFADMVCDDLKQIIRSALPASIEQTQVDEFLRTLTNNFSITVEKTIMGNVTNLKGNKTDYSVVFMKLLSSARSYRLRVPKEIATFIKLLATLGFVAKQLNSGYEIKREIHTFFKANPDLPYLPDLGITSVSRKLNREKALEELHEWLAYLVEADYEIYSLINNYIKKYNKK